LPLKNTARKGSELGTFGKRTCTFSASQKGWKRWQEKLWVYFKQNPGYGRNNKGFEQTYYPRKRELTICEDRIGRAKKRVFRRISYLISENWLASSHRMGPGKNFKPALSYLFSVLKLILPYAVTQTRRVGFTILFKR
jgi:hypothetical protein